ncbi:hypothetical protein EIP86_008682 [Pleurotus ostreatoroseus]|nr:hypothetical protein EIP86_008682 [Pleurotus ostreatoroseus]
MNGDIEELVLSGKLFAPQSRSSSPVRSRSTSPEPTPWPTDGHDYDYDSDAERRRAIEDRIAQQQREADSIGMGPGRTGVKGVIRDRNEAAGAARARKAAEIDAVNRAMEKASLGGLTWAEEEALKAREEGREKESSDRRVPLSKGRFGHLREVGARGFVQAVESEERNVWVVVHIYDPSLDRCATLDDTLSRLARAYPTVKFLRARAGALGFATSTAASARRAASSNLLAVPPFALRRTPSRKILVPGRYSPGEEDDDDFDKDEDEGSEDEGSNGGWEDDDVDTDVLPTLLVYRGGDLVHSWVRVDWEATMGIEELLRRHHILFQSSGRNLGLPSDGEDDDDLLFSASDDGF